MQASKNKQNGAALFVGLIFLLVLTILGLTAARVSTLDERMAGNFMRQRTAAGIVDQRMNAAVAWVVERNEGNVTAMPGNSVYLAANLNQCTGGSASVQAGCDGELWWQARASDEDASFSIPATTETVVEDISIVTGNASLEAGAIKTEDFFRITTTSGRPDNDRGIEVIRQMIFVP